MIISEQEISNHNQKHDERKISYSNRQQKSQRKWQAHRPTDLKWFPIHCIQKTIQSYKSRFPNVKIYKTIIAHRRNRGNKLLVELNDIKVFIKTNGVKCYYHQLSKVLLHGLLWSDNSKIKHRISSTIKTCECLADMQHNACKFKTIRIFHNNSKLEDICKDILVQKHGIYTQIDKWLLLYTNYIDWLYQVMVKYRVKSLDLYKTSHLFMQKLKN